MLNKLKLNPPETAPKDRKFLAFYKDCAITIQYFEVEYPGWTSKSGDVPARVESGYMSACHPVFDTVANNGDYYSCSCEAFIHDSNELLGWLDFESFDFEISSRGVYEMLHWEKKTK